MTSKKKILTTLSVVLILGLAVLGVLAYLTDTAKDVNVMTLGNVNIEQHEYQRAENADGTFKTDNIDNRTSYVLEAFEQEKPLLPAIIPNGGTVDGVTWGYDVIPVRMSQVDSYGGASVFNTPNAQDKFITVENTGKTDAYVRTLIAFEMGNTTVDEFSGLISAEIRADEMGQGAQPWKYCYEGEIEIDGNDYYLYEFVYVGAKISDGYRHVNGVLPAKDTTYPNLCQVYMAAEATNEDVEALDGNNNGKYDILVISQAVQTTGFTDAQVALDTAFGTASDKAAEWFAGMEATNVGATFNVAGTYDIAKTIIFEDETGDNIVACAEGVVVNVNGGYYDTGSERNNCAVWAKDGGTVNINGGTFIADGDAAPATSNSHLDLIYAGENGTINIYGGTFSIRNNNGWILNEKDNTATITVYGGSFLNWNPADNESEGANTNFLAEGYTVQTEATTEGIWYHVVEAN